MHFALRICFWKYIQKQEALSTNHDGNKEAHGGNLSHILPVPVSGEPDRVLPRELRFEDIRVQTPDGRTATVCRGCNMISDDLSVSVKGTSYNGDFGNWQELFNFSAEGNNRRRRAGRVMREAQESD